MTVPHRMARAVPLAIVLALLAPRPAYAYIDPMSGSIILQALAAGVLAGALVAKQFWHRISETARRFWQRLLS